jgi:hypothetical protein
MWRDGQTDMTKLIVALRNYAKTPKKLLNIREFKRVVLDVRYEESKDAFYGLHRV